MRLLVTGGCGFIGSNFIRYMLNEHKNCTIINLDKLTYAGNPANLKDLAKSPRYTFVKGDICNKTIARTLLAKKITAIVNFAAQTHVDRSIKDAAPFITTNIDGVRVLLEAAREYRPKRFIQISTDEAYGDVKKGCSREGDLLLPNSPYAASKAAADELCHAYYHTYGIPVIITRSSNNLGPYQYPEKVVPLFITNLMEGKKIPLYGDGKNIRDWLYVGDNCRAIDVILRKGKVGEVYNIGGNNQVQNVELARIILKEFKKGYDRIQYVTDRPGHDRRYALSSNKIKKLGFMPRYTFREALKTTIAWYNNNRWWWVPLKKKAYIIKW
jgi:dTDP-glucose 4,6-dehydratase